MKAKRVLFCGCLSALLVCYAISSLSQTEGTDLNEPFRLKESKKLIITAVQNTMIFAGETAYMVNPQTQLKDSNGNEITVNTIKPPVPAQIVYYVIPNQNVRVIATLTIVEKK